MEAESLPDSDDSSTIQDVEREAFCCAVENKADVSASLDLNLDASILGNELHSIGTENRKISEIPSAFAKKDILVFVPPCKNIYASTQSGI